MTCPRQAEGEVVQQRTSRGEVAKGFTFKTKQPCLPRGAVCCRGDTSKRGLLLRLEREAARDGVTCGRQRDGTEGLGSLSPRSPARAPLAAPGLEHLSLGPGVLPLTSCHFSLCRVAGDVPDLNLSVSSLPAHSNSAKPSLSKSNQALQVALPGPLLPSASLCCPRAGQKKIYQVLARRTPKDIPGSAKYWWGRDGGRG